MIAKAINIYGTKLTEILPNGNNFIPYFQCSRIANRESDRICSNRFYVKKYDVPWLHGGIRHFKKKITDSCKNEFVTDSF